jgi:thioredoxin 1
MPKPLAVLLILVVVAVAYAVWQSRGGDEAGSHLPSLTAEQFDETVATGIVVVDFWASWCPPCRQQLPILVDLARQVEGRALVVKVNVDEEPELAEEFGVRSIPTLLVMRDGEIVERFTGVQQIETLMRAIEQAEAAEAGGPAHE